MKGNRGAAGERAGGGGTRAEGRKEAGRVSPRGARGRGRSDAPTAQSPGGNWGAGANSLLSRPPSPHLPGGPAESSRGGWGRRARGGAGGAGGSPRGGVPARAGRERTRRPRPARLAELPAPRAHRQSGPRGSGRGLIRILFAMQQLGGGRGPADFEQERLRVRSRRWEGRGSPGPGHRAPPRVRRPLPGSLPSGRLLLSPASSPGSRLPFPRPPAALPGLPGPSGRCPPGGE